MLKKNTIKNTTQDTIQTVDIEPEKEIVKATAPRRIGLKKLLMVVLAVLAVLGIFGSYYFYNKYQAVVKNPNLEAQKETDALVLALGKLMELPTGETPTIATISDIEKLKDQPFFKNALNGDKLFAYNTAMIAILYRPSSNKIINVAPISINQPQNLTQATTKTTTSPVTNKKP